MALPPIDPDMNATIAGIEDDVATMGTVRP